MGKKGKQRWNRSHIQQKKQRPEKKTPETLIKEGNFKEAIRILKTQIATSPTDAKRRMLSDCFFRLANYKESADTLCMLSEKTDHDLLLIGYAFLNAEDWEQARHYLNESLNLGENPYTLYFLAMAYIKNLHYYDLDEVSLRHVLTFLQKARSLLECPAEVYLLLVSIIKSSWRKFEDEEAASDELNPIKILQEAFTLYPDNEDIRLRYASHLYYPEKNYEAVLMVVTPLVSEDVPLQEGLEYAFAASVGARLFEKALQYLEKLQDEEDVLGPGVAKLKGDVFLALERFDEAILCYQQEIKRDDFVAKFIGIFSHAWALILQGHTDLAIDLAQKGADLWFDRAEIYDAHRAFDTEPICVGRLHIGEDSPALFVKNVCERLLQNNDLDESLIGQLSFLFYQYHEPYYAYPDSHFLEQKEEHSRFLLEAERLFLNPVMYSSLEYYYRGAGDLPSAVKYHLDHCIHLYEHEPDEFKSRFANFWYEEDEEDGEKLKELTNDVRNSIHEIAFAKLQACKEASMIEAIFIPYFDSFWHDVLLTGEMYQFIVDITSIFIRECPDDEDEQWNYAYSIWHLGNREEAERVYRKYLENNPDNVDTLVNLSIILEERGLVQESASLINKAYNLDPNDEIVTNRHSYLQEEIKRLEEKEREKQKQEMFLRSAPERWRQVDDVEKKLLYIMTTADRWDGFTQLASKTGIGETEFQIHWKKLIELGIIFNPKEDLYQINPYIIHFVKDEGLLLSHPALTSILKDIADIETAEILLKETQVHLQSTVLGLAEQVGYDTELRDKLIWHLYWKVDRVQQTWLKKAFGLKEKELREVTTKAWVKMTCPTCKESHMVNVTTRSEFKRVQDTSWQQHYAKCPSCKENEKKRQEEESQAFWNARENRKQELHTMPYKEYLQTPEWQERRKRIMRRDRYSCQLCNAHGIRLNVHHRTYERRGFEDDGDLITLCENCHTIFYEKGKLT